MDLIKNTARFVVACFISFIIIAILISMTENDGFTLLWLMSIPFLVYLIYKLLGGNNLKSRSLKILQEECENLVHNNIEVVASAYRSTVTSNSFGKKNYTKFKKELIEYLIDNSNSKDVKYYAEHVGDFDIPDSTLLEIERAINDFAEVQNYEEDMDPYEYEHFCAEQFLIHGWDDAEATSGSSDQGVDVKAKRGDDVLVGQCKKYSKPVGNSAVQEVVAGMGYYGANIGVVISNNSFTNSAKKLAEANNIKLIHHSEIKNL
jgi:restriction system protein